MAEILDRPWTVLEPYSDDYVCEHCNQLMKRPMLTECCGNQYCAMCIEQHYGFVEKAKYNCPGCGECDINAIPDKKKWRKILELKVKCLKSGSGCHWTGKLSEGADHLERDCDFMVIDCTYRCGEKVIKAELAVHLENVCQKRPATCPHCKETGEYGVINGKHKDECPALVICPNKCGTGGIKQATMKQHLAKCPEEVIMCNFDYAGCTETMLRKKLAGHLQENLQEHLALQTEYFLAELERKDQLFQQMIIKKDGQLQQLGELHRLQLQEKDEIIQKLVNGEFQQELQERSQKLEDVTTTLRMRYSQLELNVNRLDYLSRQIETEKLELTSILHEGKSATEIWKGSYKGKAVVIKKASSDDSIPRILHEADILLKLKHDNIIELYGAVTNGEPVCLVLEYMSYGNLEKYLRVNTLLLHEQLSICKQVAQGLEYLQQKLCIHRNISSGNVLIRENQWCKLKDFSVSKLLNHHKESVPTERKFYRVKWAPPEAFREYQHCLMSDVWSYGILLWEVVTSGGEPYHGLSNNEAIAHILSATYMPRPEKCPEALYTTMLDCWRSDPWARPSFHTLVDKMDRIKKNSHKYSLIHL